VVGPGNNYWHFGSMALISLCAFYRLPAKHSVPWVSLALYPEFLYRTRFGDYPHYAPATPGTHGEFTGWMLLSYKKPVKASSHTGEFLPEYITDENRKTFWLAETNQEKEWIEIDLQQPGTVYAIQVNYQDYQSDRYGRIPGLRHRYLVEGSLDGKEWTPLADRRHSFKDTPNDYVQVETPAKVRYVRYKNIEVPTPHLAISGLRVFGQGEGKNRIR